MMDHADEARRERLEEEVRRLWRERDPAAYVTSRLRPGGLIDLTVVSHAFEGLDGLEREAAFWPVFAHVPSSDLVRMTYCALLTPDEERQLHYNAPPEQ